MSRTWRSARRVLCIRLDSLGDVLMCTPAMRALHQGSEGRRLTLLTSPEGARAAAYLPDIDDVVAFRAPWMKHGREREPAALADCVVELRRLGLDAAVIFTSFSQSPLPAAMLCHLAGIPLVAATCRENPYGLLTDWVAETERERPLRHEVQRQLDLAAAVGCTTEDTRLSFRVPEGTGEAIKEGLLAQGIDPTRPFIVLHTGASALSRRYPARRWSALLRLLGTGLHMPLVLTGSTDEAADIAAIIAESGVPASSLAGQLDLGELGALLRSAALLIANNTGPAHIAAAVGTPVVSLYAMTNAQHTPWRVAQRVLYHPVPCRDCLRSSCPQGHHACLDALAPETVFIAAAELLDDTPTRPAYAAASRLAYP
jgi:ADP-heptose:LPS heptosyltransferase